MRRVDERVSNETNVRVGVDGHLSCVFDEGFIYFI